MRERSLTLLIFLSTSFSASAATAVSFDAPPRDYLVDNAATVAEVGDFNNDEKPDIIVSTGFPNGFDLLLGNGDGTFQPARGFAPGLEFPFLTTGDFNQDGNLDVVVSALGKFGVYLGNGDGTFRNPTFYDSYTTVDPIKTGDFNHDGKLDLVSGCANGSVCVFLGSGNGTFQNPLYSARASYFTIVALGDINRDGSLDLVVGNALGSGAISQSTDK